MRNTQAVNLLDAGTITANGTPQSLRDRASNVKGRFIVLIALSTNTNAVYVGTKNVNTSNNGAAIEAGVRIPIYSVYPADVWVVTAGTDEDVSFLVYG